MGRLDPLGSKEPDRGVSRVAVLKELAKAAYHDRWVRMSEIGGKRQRRHGDWLGDRFVSFLEFYSALSRLPPDWQWVIELSYGLDIPQPQIAKIVGQPVTRVQDWIGLGFAQMAEIIWCSCSKCSTTLECRPSL
mgnify:CR=1 FL=1